MSDNRAAVSTAITDRMRELRMSAEQLAAVTELSIPAIRQIRNQPHKHRPTPKTLKLISEALGWPSKYLENVLIGRPEDETAEQGTNEAARLSSLESRMSAQEQRMHKLIVTLDQRLGDIAGGIYEADPDLAIPPEIHERDAQ